MSGVSVKHGGGGGMMWAGFSLTKPYMDEALELDSRRSRASLPDPSSILSVIGQWLCPSAGFWLLTDTSVGVPLSKAMMTSGLCISPPLLSPSSSSSSSSSLSSSSAAFCCSSSSSSLNSSQKWAVSPSMIGWRVWVRLLLEGDTCRGEENSFS